MNELKSTAALVKSILKQDERTRNSDSFLYFRVIGAIGNENGVDLNQVPVTDFLLNMNQWGFP